MVSDRMTRGHIVSISLPMLALATALAAKWSASGPQTERKAPSYASPLAPTSFTSASLLLLGHLSTTVLVDRGDASHRLSLVKDEVIVHEGMGYEFTALVLESEDLEVVWLHRRSNQRLHDGRVRWATHRHCNPRNAEI